MSPAAVASGARNGDAASAARAAVWFQSERKSWEAPSAVRLLVQLSRRPSGEKDAKPSNPSVKVTRTGIRRPSASTRNNSKFANPCLLEVKMAYSPDGCRNGAQDMELKSVSRRTSVPSTRIV